MSWWAWALGIAGDLGLVWAGWHFWFAPQIRKIARQEIDRLTGLG